MAYILLPSLKEITLIKIAFQMLHSSELKKYIFKHIFNTNSKDVEYIMSNIIKFSNTIEIPVNLKDNFYELICHMVKQLIEWTVWEPRVAEFSLYKIVFDILYWTPCGTIDKKKTAIQLVNCHCLPDAYRYEIASKYCLSDCFNLVNHQYGKMIENVFHDDDDDDDMTPCLKLVKLWSCKIGCNEEFSQDDILKGLILTLGLGNDIGGKYFWDKLSTDDQNNILDDLEPYSDMISNEDILAFLFSRMNGTQILNALTTSGDGESFYFLNESLQQIYSEICKKLWKLTCSEEFDLIFKLWLSFLEAKVITIVKGFGKYSSLKDFYKNSPIMIKNHIVSKYSNGEWINKCLESEEYNCDLIPKIIVLLKECGVYTKQLERLFCEKLLTHGKEYLAEEFANSFISPIAKIKEFHQNVFLSVKNGVWFTDLIVERRWDDIKHFLSWSHISDYMLHCLNGNYNIFDDYMFDILDIFSVSFLYLSELIDKIVFQFEKAEEKIYPSFEEILKMIFPNYDLQHLKQFLLVYFIKYAKYIKIISDEKVEIVEKQVESFLKGELKINESHKKIFDLRFRNVQVIDLILLDIPKQFKNFASWYILTDTVLFEKKISTVLKECLSQNLFDENDLKCFIHLINEFFPENGILKFKTEIAFLLPAVYYNETNFYLNNNTFPIFCYSILNEDKMLMMEILSSMTSVGHIRELLLKDNFTSIINSSFFKMIDEYEVSKWKEQMIFSLLKDKEFEQMIYDNYFEILDIFLNWCFLSKEKVKKFKQELLFHIINKYYNQENKIKHIMKEIDEFTDFCLTSNTIFLITFTEWHANVLTPFVHWSGQFSTNAETINLTSCHLKIQHYSRLFDSHEDFTNFLIENCLFKYFYRNCGIRRFVEWFGLSEQELKKELFIAGVTPFDNNDIINIIENKSPLDNYVTSLISIEEILESKETLLFRLIMSYFKEGFSEFEVTKINRLVDILFLSDNDTKKFKKKCIFCFEFNHLPQQILQSSLYVNTIDFYISIFLFSEEDVNEFKQSLFQYLKLNLCTEFVDHSFGGFCNIKHIINWFCLSEKESIGYKKEILNIIRDNGFFLSFISPSDIFVLDGLLSWGLSNSSETVNFKHSLCYYLCSNLNKCKIDLLENLDIATFFIEWCQISHDQIMAIKKQLLYSAIVESKLHILIYTMNKFRIEELLKWLFNDQQDIRDFKMIFFSSLAIQNIYLSYCGKRKNLKRMKNSHSMYHPC